MKRIPAIKEYFERIDPIAPMGGRKVEMNELKDFKLDRKNGDEALNELGKLACIELGYEYEETKK